MVSALRCGVAISDFWAMTQWHLKLAIEAYTASEEDSFKKATWQTWHCAVLGRIKHIPSLGEMLGVKKQVQGIDKNAIIAYVKAHNKRVAIDGGQNS